MKPIALRAVAAARNASPGESAMSDIAPALALATPAGAGRALPRALAVALMGFLTLVDLFAAQAILPSLVEVYGVSRAAMGFAVNASTIGMAVAGLAVPLFARRIDRRRGVALSLALLAVPTACLAFAPDLTGFTLLRVTQGLLMASAFTLTMTYLGERAGPEDAAAALAAYVTGIVASNLVGRLIAGWAVHTAGIGFAFYLFAALNLAGALLVALTLKPSMRMAPLCRPPQSARAAWAQHLASPALRAAFAIGFLILFVFIGVFTYVNFELSRAPIMLAAMDLGLVYLVFLPSMVTTPLAGRLVRRLGARRAVQAAMLLCLAALPLLFWPSLLPVLAGLTLIGIGTFFAQAAATGFVSRAAASDRAAASGLYLTSYYLGGLCGAWLLGQLYEALGWTAVLAAIALALAAAALLALSLRLPDAA